MELNNTEFYTMKKGDTYTTYRGQKCVVIEYINNREVTVEFCDEYKYQANFSAQNVRNGRIKNPYYPSMQGKGYLGVGDFALSIDGKNTVEGSAWRHMMARCYSSKLHERHPTYKECTICDEWLNFQVFAEWLTQNEYFGLGYQLDKDILKQGNKVYSPEFCSLVPPAINNTIQNHQSACGEYPAGVYLYKRYGNFRAELKTAGKRNHIGYYETPELAHQAYKIAREAYVKTKAMEWRERMSERVYNALMNWNVREEG